MSEPDLALDKASAAAALSPATRRLHRAVLAAFTETGRAPSRASLIRLARDHAADPEQTLAELAERDLLAVDNAGELRAAYPFSPTPTAIRVSWDGGPAVHAMCAVDALGISAMLDHPVTIVAAEPGTGATVAVEVDRDSARWTPATAVVFAGAIDDPCCPSVDRSCGHINFFTSAEAARAWAAGRPDVTGVVLDQAQALAAGVAEFGPLLRDAAPATEAPSASPVSSG